MRGWGKVFHINGNEQKARAEILISDKIDFKTKTETRDKIRTLHKDQEINPRRYNNCKSKKI